MHPRYTVYDYYGSSPLKTVGGDLTAQAAFRRTSGVFSSGEKRDERLKEDVVTQRAAQNPDTIAAFIEGLEKRL